jgi:hydroxypyruvate isomerase
MQPTLRFSADLSPMFTEVPFLERFGAARVLAFRASNADLPNSRRG